MTITTDSATLYIQSAFVFIGCAGLCFAFWAHTRLSIARVLLRTAVDRLAEAKDQRLLTMAVLGVPSETTEIDPETNEKIEPGTVVLRCRCGEVTYHDVASRPETTELAGDPTKEGNGT